MTLTEQIAVYLPSLILERFASQRSAANAPAFQRFPAAALFGDISGFTGLTERLAQRGPAGAEELNRVLCAYFELLIDIVAAHGGDVVKFAGDGVLALWRPEGEELADAACRAAQCAVAIQDKLHHYLVAEDVRLSMHIGLGAGEIRAFHVGGVRQRWEMLITGAPLSQIDGAVKHAEAGEVVLSREAWALVANRCGGEMRGTQGEACLRAVLQPTPLRAAVRPAPMPANREALQSYLPGAIRARLAAGQSDWLAELRRVSVLFVNLPDLNETLSLTRAQTVFEAMQTALYRYEGSVGQLGVDDKGITLVAALGLPPLAHEDDAPRAVEAAQAIQASLRELGVRSAIGIATGRIFCGSVGSARRREFAMSGDVVNLAARLMEAAPGDILCDSATYQAARGRLRFEPLPALALKGKSEPVAVFRPYCQAPVEIGEHMIIGRTAEREALSRQTAGLLAGRSGVVLVEGEAGIGKSRLIAEFQIQAAAAGVKILAGAADAVEKSTPYHAWRSVFTQLFDLEGVVRADMRRTKILERLQSEPELRRCAPLLNAVLSLDLPDNEITSQMTGQVRADNTNDLLVCLLQAEVKRSPLGIVLEDAHWLDSASWGLVSLAIQQVRPALLVIAARPPEDSYPDDYHQLLNQTNFEHLRLAPLPLENVKELACRCLGVEALPPAAMELIQEKANGNPFFSEELAYALRDSGLIQITGGQCLLTEGVKLSSVSFPASVQGVIISRMDRLNPSQQLTLKVASVIGRVFAFRVLHDIYPIEPDKVELGENLSALQKLDLTPQESPEPELAYIFKHVITQEVAYNLLLFAQRRQLHRAVAEWYEQSQREDLTPIYPLLAHHWTRAEDRAKSLEYLGRAGEQALRNGAYHEAAEFLASALTCDASAKHPQPSIEPTASDLLRRARWERLLGEAYVSMGRLAESREHSLRALRLLGRPAPIKRASLFWHLGGQLLLQAFHRFQSKHRAIRSPEARAACQEAASAYERLGHVSYYEGEKFMAVYAEVSSLNLAERIGPSPELLRGYASMSVAANIVALHGLSRMYGRLAERAAPDVGDLSAKTWMLEMTGMVYFSVGRWQLAEERLTKGVELSYRIGDWRRWQESLVQLALIALLRGDFSKSVEQSQQVLSMARRRASEDQAQAWALNVHALSAFRMGEISKAATLLQEAAQLTREHMGKTEALLVHGSSSMVHWRLGERESALRAATMALQIMETSTAMANYTFEAIAGTAETFLEQWGTVLDRHASGERKDARRHALRAGLHLHSFAKLFPVAGPRSDLLNGAADWLTGNRRKARRRWKRSLAAAEELGMPYEQGLALYRLGIHSEPGEPEGANALKQAVEIFERLGALDDLSRARAALGEAKRAPRADTL